MTSLAQHHWVEARKKSHFETFRPWLEQIIALKREEASALGSGTGVLYDALLMIMSQEPRRATSPKSLPACGRTSFPWCRQFANLRCGPTLSILCRHYPKDAQRAFARKAATAIGFRFEDGRLDESPHPFCTGIGPGDCRLTTRYDEHHFPGAFFGVLHEAGHGFTSRDSTARRSARRSVTPPRSAFTSPNPGCGRTSSAAAGPSGSIFIRRPKRLFRKRSTA